MSVHLSEEKRARRSKITGEPSGSTPFQECRLIWYHPAVNMKHVFSSYLQSSSSLLPRLAYFLVRFLHQKAGLWDLWLTAPGIAGSRGNIGACTHTWAAWRSSARSPSSPSQIWRRAPTGRCPIACAFRSGRIGPARAAAHAETEKNLSVFLHNFPPP